MNEAVAKMYAKIMKLEQEIEEKKQEIEEKKQEIEEKKQEIEEKKQKVHVSYCLFASVFTPPVHILGNMSGVDPGNLERGGGGGGGHS